MKREPIRITYKLKFEGGDADRHQLEAYPAAQSLEGIIWALSITLNYGVTGKIRQRGDLSGACKVYISPPKRGSVLYELNILVQDNAFIALILGGWAVNTATPYINALIGHVFNSALGVASEIPVRARKYLNKLNEDDLQKVVHRIEPPLTRGHAAIGKTAATVSLRAKNTELTELQGENPLILPIVDEQAVASVVGDWTGIPVGRMVKDEIDTILHLEEHLAKRVIGQDHAMKMIAKRIQTSRAGLDNPSKPIGVFLLAGTSGVGKTETALGVADLLFGKVNPSGKAPVTFPVAGRRFLDALAPEAYPGVLKDGKAAVSYLEGRYMGYRWYDGNRSGGCALEASGENPCVAFPFGHGLSYTTFSLTPFTQRWEGGVLKLETTVKNRGDRAGAEVVQVYLGLSEPGQPPKRLVAFQRVALAPGEARSVTLSVDPEASHHPFDVFDEDAKAFRPAAGPSTVYLGTSSSLRDLTVQPLAAGGNP